MDIHDFHRETTMHYSKANEGLTNHTAAVDSVEPQLCKTGLGHTSDNTGKNTEIYSTEVML